jgi:hypothetical protein
MDYSEVDKSDLESENLLSINKVMINSIHQSVGAAVILFEFLVVLFFEITNSLILVDNTLIKL